jgi:hypothetical protein
VPTTVPTPTPTQASGINHKPVAVGAVYDVVSGGSVPITLNGSDPDTEDIPFLTYDVLIPPTRGVLSGLGQPRTYASNPEEAGTDYFVYEVRDHRGLTSGGIRIDIRINSSETCPAAAKPTVKSIVPAHLRMVTVGITGDIGNVKILKVYQDEPTGRSRDASRVLGGPTVKLRAQRKSKTSGGNGRVYTLHYEAIKLAGGLRCNGTVTVSVPLRSSKPAIKGSALYDSTLLFAKPIQKPTP